MSSLEELLEFHWMMDMVQTIDVGVVVIDRQFNVRVWNNFMESHTSIVPDNARDKSLFTLFPDIDEGWFRQKCRPVFDLKSSMFITWEQRPYLFKFPNYRPITGAEPYMYQNITLSPLTSASGQVDHVSLMVYDVTDVASHKKQLEALQVEQAEQVEKQ